MRLDAIAIGKDPPRDINVIIEVPIGGEPIKYEMDKASGALVVDRFLYTPMRYPGNYGFVPHTLSADGDPIDVLVCNTRALFPGAVINCRPVGVLVMQDEGGGDEKVLAVPSRKLTQRYDKVANSSDLLAIGVVTLSSFTAETQLRAYDRHSCFQCLSRSDEHENRPTFVNVTTPPDVRWIIRPVRRRLPSAPRGQFWQKGNWTACRGKCR